MKALLAPRSGADRRGGRLPGIPVLRDKHDPDHFVFIEQWRDDTSLDVHRAQYHVTSMLSAVQPLLALMIRGTRLTKR